MAAYEDMIRHTSNKYTPWFVVPADNKWFTRLEVVAAVIDALQNMELAFPTVDADKRRELRAIRQALEAKGRPAKKRS